VFFSLATFWLFYEAIRETPLRARYVTLSTVGFILSYFSWQGSGLTLPALFVAMVLVKWREFGWIRDWHLWRCFLLIAAVVVLQLAHRELVKPAKYLTIGIDLSDLATPQLEYLDPTTYQPKFYLYYYLFQENYYVMTLLSLGGLFFAWRDRALRYTLVVLFSLLMFLTELLPNYDSRYSENTAPLLILAAAATSFKLWDRITRSEHEPSARWSGPLRLGAAAAMLLLLILSANQFALKTYRLSWSPYSTALGVRLGTYWVDHRGTADFLRTRISTQDAVVARIPNAMEFYSVKFNHTVSTMVLSKLFYDGGRETPGYGDQYRGYPTLRGVEDLEELRSRYARVWYVQAPLVGEHPAMQSYLEMDGKVVFESYGIRVILLEGPQSSTLETKRRTAPGLMSAQRLETSTH
jgi:hypothetical protein